MILKYIRLVFLLFSVIITTGCEEDNPGLDVTETEKKFANVIIYGEPIETVYFSNGYPSKLGVTFKLKNDGEDIARNVVVKYTNDPYSTTLTPLSKLEIEQIVSSSFTIDVTTVPANEGTFKVTWN